MYLFYNNYVKLGYSCKFYTSELPAKLKQLRSTYYTHLPILTHLELGDFFVSSWHNLPIGLICLTVKCEINIKLPKKITYINMTSTNDWFNIISNCSCD